jgi:hypothetical protein
LQRLIIAAVEHPVLEEGGFWCFWLRVPPSQWARRQ